MQRNLLFAAIGIAALIVAARWSTLDDSAPATRRYVQCLGHHPDAPDRPGVRPAECS